jgi:TRAP-type C4-dicarboxylate transport system substrate-binding protein
MKRLAKAVLVVGLFLVGGIGLIFAASSKATAQTETALELKFASIWPSAHPFSEADRHWIEKIENETKGRVKIKAFWGGTLISPREGLLEAIKGVADIIYFTPAYEKTGLDLIKAQAGFYQGAPSQEAELKIFWQLWEKYPEIRQELQGVKLLNLFVAAPLRLMTIKPMKSLDDLKGMRIKAPREVLQTLRAFGAEGVIIPMTETYESLQKGIIGGAFGALEAYKTLKFAEVVKYETNLLTYIGTIPAHVMPLASWSKLPTNIQKIFDDSRDWWDLETVREAAKADNEGREVAKKAGVQLIQLPQSDIEKWNDTYNGEMLKKAEELDAKGLPGTRYYQDVRRLINEMSGKK